LDKERITPDIEKLEKGDPKKANARARQNTNEAQQDRAKRKNGRQSTQEEWRNDQRPQTKVNPRLKENVRKEKLQDKNGSFYVNKTLHAI